MMMTSQYAVVAVKAAHGKTHEPPFTDPGYPQGHVFRFDAAVFQDPFLHFIIRIPVQNSISGNVIITAIAFHAVEVKGKVTRPGIKAAGTVHPVGNGFVLKRYIAFQGIRNIFEDAIIDDVDHAAACPAAEKQRCGTLKNFNLACKSRFRWNCMVSANVRHIHGTDAVFKDAYPAAGQSADDGTSHSRAEVTGAHTQFICNRFPYIADTPGFQFILTQDLDGHHQVGIDITQRVSCNGDLLYILISLSSMSMTRLYARTACLCMRMIVCAVSLGMLVTVLCLPVTRLFVSKQKRPMNACDNDQQDSSFQVKPVHLNTPLKQFGNNAGRYSDK